MSDQTSMFDTGAKPWQQSGYPLYDGTPPHEQADTSHEAAATIRPEVNKLQASVLAAIVMAGPAGMTDEELTDRLEMNPSTLRPRRRELELLGKIVHHGIRATRAGRSAKVWVAVRGGA